jgi:large subunit ribosomal protein L25
MKTIEIKANLRKETGKSASRQIRREKNVPGVIYSKDENINFITEELAFKDLIYSPNVYLVKLDIDGKKYNAVLQDIQYHPVTDRILHVDFIQIFEDKPLTINIPINVIGDSVGLKAGGKLRVRRRKIRVKGLMKDLPDTLDVDITRLEIGQTIKVGELSYDNLELIDPHQSMVLAIASSRVTAKGMEEGELGVEPEAEEAEGEEAEGEVTEGEEAEGEAAEGEPKAE